MEEVTKHYLISGRVQGVGFRAFTHAQATQLGVRGWVRNLSDGRVEALAIGTAGKLALFEAQLKSGPTRDGIKDKVESLVITEWKTKPVANAPHSEFEVRKDGLAPCSEK